MANVGPPVGVPNQRRSVPESLKHFPGVTLQNDLRWDPSRCCSGLALDAGNRILYQNVGTNIHKCCAALTGFNSGKHYWELKVVDAAVSSFIMIGVSSLAVPTFFTTTNFPGHASDDGCALYLQNGHAYYSNTNRGPLTAKCVNGDIIGVLLNMDDCTVTFFKNGVLLGCGAGVDVIKAGRTYFPVVALYELGHRVVLLDDLTL